MGSTVSIILKNLILLILLSISLVFIFTKNIGFNEVKYVFGIVGLLYIFASCYEAYAISKTNTSAKKIIYFTYGFLATRFIKVISFICCGIILYISGSLIKYLAFVCFLIALTEIVVLIYRYVKGLSYIAFDGNLLIISTNKLDIMNAGSVKKIETRHGLTYLVDNKNKSLTLRTDIIKNQNVFNEYLNTWIEENHITDKVVLT